MALETKIAQVHWAAERTRDTLANYNPKNRGALIAFAPGLDWQGMLDTMGIGMWDRYNVNTPTALQGIARLVQSVPLDDWKAYLTYHHLHAHAPVPAQGRRRRDLRVLRQDAGGPRDAA